MSDSASISGEGVKCDNPNCDYYDDTENWSDIEKAIEKYKDAKCPKCGAPLLTESDIQSLRVLKGIVDNINNLDLSKFQEMGIEIDDGGISNDKQSHLFHVDFDGTGNISIKDSEDDKV